MEDISIAMPKRVMHDIEGNLNRPISMVIKTKQYTRFLEVRLNVLLMNLAEKGGAKIFFNHECIDVSTNKCVILSFDNTITL